MEFAIPALLTLHSLCVIILIRNQLVGRWFSQQIWHDFDLHQSAYPNFSFREHSLILLNPFIWTYGHFTKHSLELAEANRLRNNPPKA